MLSSQDARALGAALARVFADPALRVSLALALDPPADGRARTWTEGGCSIAAAAMRRWFRSFHFVGLREHALERRSIDGREVEVQMDVVEYDGWLWDADGLVRPGREDVLVELDGPVPPPVRRRVSVPGLPPLQASCVYPRDRGLSSHVARHHLRTKLGEPRSWGLVPGLPRASLLRPASASALRYP